MAKNSHSHGGSTPRALTSCFNNIFILISALFGVLMISVALSNTDLQPHQMNLSAVAAAMDDGVNHARSPAASARTKTPSNIVSVKKGKRLQTCDLFDGRWVYDESTHPLYSGYGCPFITSEVACDKYGRNDTRYQHWRWQPHGCDLPRFNGTKLLERLRGKRMVFVGDSLNRNQWFSMVCLLEPFITGHKSIENIGSLKTFKAQNYNASIDFYWAPLLLESNCDSPIYHRESVRIIRDQSIEKHARHWDDADILIFNSYLWWMKPNIKLKVLYGPGSLTDENATFYEIELKQGFELALKTWSNWLQFHMETQKKQIYFVSLSPVHNWGEDWGAANNRNCYGETEPIHKFERWSTGTHVGTMRKAEQAIKDLREKGVDVHLLNITWLSEHRKDGHPSIHKKQWDTLSEEQLANPASYSDCHHWCLPGVPDTWNELLYAHIFAQHHEYDASM